MNISKNSSIGIIGYKKCKCSNCLGYIPYDVVVYDSENGDPMNDNTKDVLKESLPAES